MTRFMVLRRPWIWLTSVAVIVVLAAVVGPYVYIHFIEGTPPAKLTFASAGSTTPPTTSTPTASTPTASTPTTASATTSRSAPASSSATPATSGAATGGGVVDGSYTVAAGSQAGYRVPETLFGQSTEAVGRTSNISGTVMVAGTTIQRADIVVDLKSVKSDRSQRDSQFQGRIMNTATYPTANFSLASPIDMGGIPADQAQISIRAAGNLTLHGVTKPISVDLLARRNGANLEVNGAIPVTFSDYGISNPSLGPASVGDTGSIEFLLIFQKTA